MVERSSVSGSEGCVVSRGGWLREHWGNADVTGRCCETQGECLRNVDVDIL